MKTSKKAVCTKHLKSTVSIDQALRKAYNTLGQRWIADCKRYTVLLPQEKAERDDDLRDSALQEYKREISVSRSLYRILAEKKKANEGGGTSGTATRHNSNPLPRVVRSTCRPKRPKIKRSRTSISSLLLKSELFQGERLWLVSKGVSSLQRSILKEKVTLYGGSLCLDPSADTTKVVTALSFAQLRQWLKEALGSSKFRARLIALLQSARSRAVHVVKLRFLTEALRMNKPQTVAEHSLGKLEHFVRLSASR